MIAASSLLDKLKAQGFKLVTAESCTGGLIGATITSIPGSSAVYDRGFITYSNEAKTEMLGVPASVIEEHGAVSEQVAAAMALGALKNTKADIAISATGVAGPASSEAKPVGLVYIGVATAKGVRVIKNNIAGGRTEIQFETVARALALAESAL